MIPRLCFWSTDERALAAFERMISRTPDSGSRLPISPAAGNRYLPETPCGGVFGGSEPEHSDGMGGIPIAQKSEGMRGGDRGPRRSGDDAHRGGRDLPGANGRIILNRGTIQRPTFLVSMEPDGSDKTRLTTRSRSNFGASWDQTGARPRGPGDIDIFTIHPSPTRGRFRP
jgi:hypothetical protein